MKKAFVLIDYQNDFIDGNLGFEQALKIKNNLLEALNQIDFNTTHLLITYDTHDKHYLKSKEGLLLPIKHCIKDSFGWQMPEEFEFFLQKAHKIFYKSTFGSLKLANFIQRSNYEEIHFAGLISHVCVFCNIILALSAKPNARIILHQDLSVSFDSNLEKSAFDMLKTYGVEMF